MNEQELAVLVTYAREGDQNALEMLIEHVQRRVYNLALRMLQLPMDAEDAAQEILIKIVTHLSEYRGEAAFTTWVYRIATNHLLTRRRNNSEMREMSFESMAEQLDLSLALGEASIPEQYEMDVLVAETRIRCTLGMMQCLDRDHRIALILGEILRVSGDEGAYILGIPAATYRKRLSRARLQIKSFTEGQCGLVNPANPCRCAKHVGNKIKFGVLNPAALEFARGLTDQQIEAQRTLVCDELHELEREVSLMRAVPEYATPMKMLNGVKTLLNSGNYQILRQ